MDYYFPFGKPLLKVEQKDRSPKEVFILGVYASAVHARWIGRNKKQKVNALAVASEPEIFWKGENAKEIIASISIPEELGWLTTPTNKSLNGPSGIALDEYFLKPLNLDRKKVWLCDLLPYSRVNAAQRKALNNHYTDEISREHNLQPATIPDFSKSEVNDERMEEIYQELLDSKADTIILLGDEPINKFLGYYVKERSAKNRLRKKFSKLSDFGTTIETYGIRNEVTIAGRKYQVIPLCHPRQAAKLGNYSKKWNDLHTQWVEVNKIKF